MNPTVPLSDTFKFPRNDQAISLGRDPSCHIVLNAVGVSRIHAKIQCCENNDPVIIDEHSTMGVRINGLPVTKTNLHSGDTISLGVVILSVIIDDGTLILKRAHQITDESSDEALSEGIDCTIGRDPQNRIVLNHPMVSRFHAAVCRNTTGRFLLTDLGSANGTYHNGKSVHRAGISEGDVVQIGPFRFFLDRGMLVRADQSDRIRLEAFHLSVTLGKRRLLSDVSLTIEPGEFVVMLGPSGAGKTTLAKAIIGQTHISGGQMFINSLPARQFFSGFATAIGYVSQHNLLRNELTVYETFYEQSLLRLPRDTTETERRERISVVMKQLDIAGCADRRIARLSGGEAKRVHFGVELLSSPRLIFLDEPLAGLDPGLVATFMRLFRKLCDQGHSIVLTTHTLEQVELCDKILFVNAGRLTFSGSPADMMNICGTKTLQELYEQAREGCLHCIDRPVDGSASQAGSAMIDLKAKKQHRHQRRRSATASWFVQLSMMVMRYSKIMVRDWKNLILIAIQAPVVAMLLSLVFGRDTVFLPMSFYFCVCIAAIWFGGVNTVREIAREWEVVSREFRVGTSTLAYGTSRVIVAGLLSFLQAGLFIAALSLCFSNLQKDLSLWCILFVAIFGGSMLGLLISALSGNVGRAISWLPIVFIPQIFFSGILIPFDRMTLAGEQFSLAMLSRPIFSMLKKVNMMDIPLRDLTEWRWIGILLGTLVGLLFMTLKFQKRFSRIHSN